jgi:CubicO group peptidase (beta-lactamase class C family)
MAGLMAERHVPGAVVLVVKDGAVVFARGYGHADPATRRPVDPATTLFRVASVSKLFTATAVMQLVEEGKVDLDADVNVYLEELQVPAAFGAPITLRQLLTHTPGFDDAFLDGSERLGNPLLPLGPYLAKHLPARVQPPGAVLSYSNHGIALAGHVVEAVSGLPFRDYVRARIFEPLGMTASRFSLTDPPPAALAVGSDWKDGGYVPVGLDRMRWYPAGDLVTSAGEIASFMQAHLDGGRVPGSDARILREDTVHAMQTQGFTHHPEIVGWRLGFEHRRWNDVDAVAHGGSWNGFGTELVLVPDAKLGLFVSTTRSNDARFFRPLLRAFFDRYFPPASPRVALAPDAASLPRAQQLAGTYVPNRHARGDLLKLGLFLESFRVAAGDDGSATFVIPAGLGDPVRAVEIAPDLWQSVADETRIAVLRDASGDVARVAVGPWVYDRVAWWRSPVLHQAVFGLCAAVFAGTLAAFCIGALLRAFASQPASPLPVGTRLLACAGAALGLGALLAVSIGLTRLSPFDLFVAVPAWLRTVGVASIATVPIAVFVLAAALRTRSATPLARGHLFVLGVALALFAAIAWSYNLFTIA